MQFQTLLNNHQFIDSNNNTSVSPLQIILGKKAVQKLQEAKIFMIGAGAIGCELLKNYAMASFCTEGTLYITDPDIIENSNLNRQFLFREKHIRKPKSLTAAAVAVQMNPRLQNHIVARLDKVCQESANIYHQQFFEQLNCVTNALDNVQARLYVDSRCVEANIPLIESGTLGPKGHVQVILPNFTESYGSKRDPEEENEIPYCTLKMFPETNIHCLEWARDKFESYFVKKPQAIIAAINAYNSPNQKAAFETIQQQTLELACKILQKLPQSFEDCIYQARLKYEKLFNWSIKQLLTAYPLESKTKDGKLFWSAPKRPPKELNFVDEGHWGLQFVIDYSILTAKIYKIEVPQINKLQEHIIAELYKIQIPQFTISKNKIAHMQQQVQKDQGQQQEIQIQQEQKSFDQIVTDLMILLKKDLDRLKKAQPMPEIFEKDDDKNHHISFITSATNGRAKNYAIQQVDWLWVKLKAGRIVPAMATTTACISALQTIETIKVIACQQLKIEDYKNAFMNLAIPCLMQSEPGACEKTIINPSLEITIWTKIQIKLSGISESLLYFREKLEETLKCKLASIKQGAKPIFLEQMVPKDSIEKENLMNTPILKLIQWNPNQGYVDLDITVIVQIGEILGPRIRVII